VTRRGAAPHVSAPANVTQSVAAVVPPAPPAGAACTAPPPDKQGRQTPVSAEPRTTASAARSESSVTVPAEQAPSATSQEVMDTSPTPPAPETPKERRSSLERTKKERLRITGPPKDPGAPPHQTSPPARPVHSKPMAMAPAPEVVAAKPAPLPQTLSPAAPGTSGLKASSHQARSQTRSTSLQTRAASASREAMDTTPAPLVPTSRRCSTERVKKGKKPITGPGDDPDIEPGGSRDVVSQGLVTPGEVANSEYQPADAGCQRLSGGDGHNAGTTGADKSTLLN
ncbi:translation initiation factor IF-2-like, partial [Rhipicephalus sanguineus]|uniref:translation initiation factor IF-2-like n=1 Tax=Rhipicephalus sanguineus TaxID=34632 RepID=UPI0018933BE9